MVINALKKAFKVAKPQILNSDQGCQFTSQQYIDFVKVNGIRQSMDGKSRWADNIMIERWFRSFKYEEAYLTQYNNCLLYTSIKRCCCFAHIRRYFFDAIPKGKNRDISCAAVQGVEYCDKLFAYERHFKEKGYSYKQIKNGRLKKEKPVIEAFLSWLEKQDPIKAVSYTHLQYYSS